LHALINFQLALL